MIPGTNLRLLAPASGGYVIEGSGLWGGSAVDYLAVTMIILHMRLGVLVVVVGYLP